jgi:hypothetical protein
MCNAMTRTCKFEEGNFRDRIWYRGIDKCRESRVVLEVEVREIGQENGTVQRWVDGERLCSHLDKNVTEISFKNVTQAGKYC